MDLVFLDANILFSAAYRKKSALLKFWNLKNAKLTTSSYAFDEASRNLDTREQRKRLEGLVSQVSLINILPIVEISRDVGLREKDLPILKAAIFVKASHLVTGDKRDFGKYFNQTIQGVLILTPADYLRSQSNETD